ncbi:DUF1080 domain-containing protein [soil metagenome]
MLRHTRLLSLTLAALLASPVLAEEPEVPDFARQLPEIKTSEPGFEFNGKDLSGFYTYLRDNKLEDPNGVFTVKDGMIRVSGEEFGGFATQENYRDYHLVVEWKWGGPTFAPREEKTRDSGILLHCVGPDGAAGGNWMESQECQIIEGGSGDFIIVGGENRPSLSCEVRESGGQLYWHPGGEKVTRNSGRFNWWGRDPEWKDVKGFRGQNDVEKPVGEWNRMEVVCDGDSITNILNGYVVNHGTESSHTEGKIQFQSEGAEIFFRKIEIRPLVR